MPERDLSISAAKEQCISRARLYGMEGNSRKIRTWGWVMCKKKDCERCLCSTCMHQGFDCECSEVNKKAIRACDEYDEMQGEQMKLEL